MTYFNEYVFGWPDLNRDLFHYFGSDVVQARVREVHRSERAFNGKMIADR